VLRLIGAAVLATACLAAAPSATADHRGAGSALDYELHAEHAHVDAADTCSARGYYDDRCVGESACWVNDPAAVQDVAVLADQPRRRGDHVVFISCVTASGDQWSRWYWSSQEPSAAER